MDKVGRVIYNSIDKILMIFFVIVLLLSCYILYDIYHIRYISSDSSFRTYKPNIEKPEAYKEISDECIGWITLDNSSIDYPIMQAENNTKYLNLNPYGEYALSGSIFLDWQNNKDFSDAYSLLYGHQMTDGLMFGALSYWEDETYFNTHLNGKLIVDKTIYNIKVFSLVITDAKEKVFFDPTSHTNQLNTIKSNYMYFNEIPENSRIIALSTCRDAGTTKRTILFVYIVE